LWKNVVSNDYPRGRKIPIDANTFGAGSSTNPATWSTFDNVMEVYTPPRHTGCGFVLTPETGIFCIDVDVCIHDDQLNEVAKETLDIFGDRTYVEASFHRDGIHIFGKGKLPEGVKGGKFGDIEIYDSGRYIAITGFRLKSSNPDIVDCPTELNAICEKFKKPQQKPVRHGCSASKPTIRPDRNGKSISDTLGLSCAQIGFPVGAIKTQNGYQGAHPFHGSKTGFNFAINTLDNVWYCFRDESGGGPLELYAVSMGIIECEDSKPGCLQGHWAEIFSELEKDGYVLNDLNIPSSLIDFRLDTKKKLLALGVI
jgi:hypothetical protein